MSGAAARTIAIRLTADNAEPTRRALEQVGETGDRALRRIDAASAAAQPALQGLAAASDGAVRAFANMGVGLGGVERVFAGVAGGAGAATAAIAALAAGAVAAGVAVARAGDQATESIARLQAATGSIAAAEAAYQGLYRLSQQTGVAVSESAGAFARFALAAREVGELTADVMMPALLRAGERINAEFERLPPTMGRSFSILGEAMTRFAADLDRALGLSQAIARAAQAAAAAGGVAPPLPCPDAGSPDLDQAQRTCPSVRPRGRAARLATSGLGGEPVRV